MLQIMMYGWPIISLICGIFIECIGFQMQIPTFGLTGCRIRAMHYGLLEYHESTPNVITPNVIN